MAVTEKKNIWFLSSPDGTPPPVRTYQMAASQGIFMPGAPVVFDAAGQLVLVADDGGTMLGYVVGVVDKSKAWPLTAALSAGDEVRVAIARAGDLYAAMANDDTPNDVALAQTDVNESMAITVSATAGIVGYTTVNNASTTGTMYRCVDLMFNREPSKHALANSPGIAIVQHTGTLEG